VESRTGDSGGSADAPVRRWGSAEDEGEQQTAATPAEEPRRRSRAARRSAAKRSRRPRFALALVLVLVVAAGLYGVSTIGPVRTVLGQSFTNETKPTVDFYFNGSPYVSGEWLEVPLGVLNAPQSGTYTVKLWIVDVNGKVLSTETAKLPYKQGHGAANLNLLLRGAGQLVYAQVVGTSLTVHFRFEGSPLGTVSPSASATGKG
jgi:hypothetical protein